MYKLVFVLIVLLASTPVAIADPAQDAIEGIRRMSGRLRDVVVASSPLVGDRAEAAKIKRSLNQTLNGLEKLYKCKATKTVEIDTNKLAVTVTFVSKTSPVLSFIVVAQNDNLVLEQATFGGFRVVNIDPYGLDR
jgi:hypothetical protein